MSISQNHSNVISIIRNIAMFGIIICHILQTFNSDWAWIFNIGVQIFIVISGYLYGHKCISNFTEWFKHRIAKVYVPYILYSIIILTIYSFFDIEQIGIKEYCIYITDIQAFMGGVKPLKHLWFITAIMICYVITPFLQLGRKYYKVIMFMTICLLIFQYYIFNKGIGYSSWIYLYVIGYYIPILTRRQRCLVAIFFTLTLSFALMSISWNGIRNSCIENTILHINASILLVLLIPLFNRICHSRKYKFLEYLNGISYYLFLVHLIYVRPPFHLLNITSNIIINIGLIFALIWLSALLLRSMTNKLLQTVKLV